MHIGIEELTSWFPNPSVGLKKPIIIITGAIFTVVPVIVLMQCCVTCVTGLVTQLQERTCNHVRY